MGVRTDVLPPGGEPFVARRPAGAIRFVTTTGFYPQYDPANDQVDRISPIATTRFQRVIPRYRLSASETADTGLGPALESIPVYTTTPRTSRNPERADAPRSVDLQNRSGERGRPTVAVQPRTPLPAPLPEGAGTLVDVYA